MFNCAVTESAVYTASKCLQSRQLSEGRRVRDFEVELETQLGLRYPVCTNSGTSALHLALRLAKVQPGDEVILPAQTFIATGMVVLHCGAKPVFADVDPATGLLDPLSAAIQLSPRTRAILWVDWCGLPLWHQDVFNATLGPLPHEDAPECYLVEDAAQALGATCRGRPVGGVSADITCFSFQATKHLTTGDGGAVCCTAKWDAGRARRLRWFGMDREEVTVMGERPSTVENVGYKYHMNDLAAAIGLGNLFGFKSRLARRQIIGARYREALQNVPGLKVPPLPPDRTHAYYAFPVLVERREDFHRVMQERGVPSSVISRRIDRHPVFGGLREDLPGTDHYDQHQINLPCHDGLTDEDVQQVVDSIRRGW